MTALVAFAQNDLDVEGHAVFSKYIRVARALSAAASSAAAVVTGLPAGEIAAHVGRRAVPPADIAATNGSRRDSVSCGDAGRSASTTANGR